MSQKTGFIIAGCILLVAWLAGLAAIIVPAGVAENALGYTAISLVFGSIGMCAFTDTQL